MHSKELVGANSTMHEKPGLLRVVFRTTISPPFTPLLLSHSSHSTHPLPSCDSLLIHPPLVVRCQPCCPMIGIRTWLM